MPFRFPLQTLLRFRQSMERQQELRLQEANRQVAAVRLQIENVEQRKDGLAETERRELAAGVSAAQLHFHILVRSLLGRKRELLEHELAQCEEVRRQRHSEFRQAHQEREVVTALREDQLRTYAQTEARREQRRLDDMFLLRREFLRRR
jgi:flagellar export protein FliJ